VLQFCAVIVLEFCAIVVLKLSYMFRIRGSDKWDFYIFLLINFRSINILETFVSLAYISRPVNQRNAHRVKLYWCLRNTVVCGYDKEQCISCFILKAIVLENTQNWVRNMLLWFKNLEKCREILFSSFFMSRRPYWS